MRFTNLYYLNSENIGDRFSGPALYFPEFDFGDLNGAIDPNLPIIVGGGGIHYPTIENQLITILDSHKAPVVLWGMGCNLDGSKTPAWGEWMDRFALCGVRDTGSRFPWVPCASCMNPLFESTVKPSMRMVAYLHHQLPIPSCVAGLPFMANDASKLENVVRFMAQAEFVITNTYHGAFWATLLGKRVICQNPFSNKFYAYRHPPTFFSGNLEQSMESAVEYPNALDECREANRNLFSQVISL